MFRQEQNTSFSAIFPAVFLLIFLPFLCRVRRKRSRDLTYCGCREKDICEWRFKNMFSNVLFEKLLWTFMPDLLRKLDECGTFQMSIIRRKMHHYYFCRRRRLPYCTAGCTVPKVHWIGRGACWLHDRFLTQGSRRPRMDHTRGPAAGIGRIRA